MVTRSLVVASVAALAVSAMYAQRNPHTEIFATSDQCVACHNGLRTPAGEDVSIGASWRASMMANSSRDPYWQAGVRREMIDHPAAAAEIQDECANVSHADVAHRGADQWASRRGVQSPARGGQGRSIRSPCPRRRRLLDMPSDYRPESRHTRKFHRRLRGFAFGRHGLVPGRPTAQAHVRPLQDRAGDDNHHEIGDRVRANRSPARAAVRTVRDMPHAHDEGPWPRGRRHWRAARAGPLSGVEAQRVQRGATQLPVVPHAGGRAGHADCVGAWRPAQRIRAPHVRRRQFLHAAFAQPVS